MVNHSLRIFEKSRFQSIRPQNGSNSAPPSTREASERSEAFLFLGF